MNGGLPHLLAFGFANPWLLLGLALGAVPILLHLLYRRAYRETNWAAMRFLVEAARKNSRRIRLEQLILLAVRTLVLVFAALAFAQPLVEGVASRKAARVPIHRVIVIDASFSMGARAEAETRFARAKKVAHKIVSDSLAGDAFHLLRIAEKSSPAVIREAAFERDAVLAEIDRLQVTDEPGDLRQTLMEIQRVLSDPRAPANKEVLFISDFQRVTWSSANNRSDDSMLQPELQRIARQASIVLVDVGDGHTDNVAVTSLQTAEPIAITGRPTRLRAGIRNFGTANLAGLRAELYVDGYLTGYSAIDVPARSERIVTFNHEFRAAGEHAVEVRIPSDLLPADNQRWLSLPVDERLNVLVVNGREAGRASDNASFYVRTVLAPSTARESWTGATLPKVINEADLASEDLSQYDCVFLCDVALITPTEANLLQAYVERGGGVILALGDRIRAENYNAMLYRDGQGILPAPLGARIGSNDEHGRGYTFNAADLTHPIVAPFRGNPGAGLDRAVTFQYIQTKVPSPARVALKFDSGDPAIIERQIGAGRCILLTTSPDVSWSAWPVHPTFPPLIHEAVRFSAQGRWHERQRLVGESLIRTLSSREAGLTITVRSPDGSEQTVRPVLAEKQAQVVFTDTPRRGIYEMQLGKSASGQRSTKRGPERFAVNVDTRESDLQIIDDKTLGTTTFAGIPYTRRTDWSGSSRELAEGTPESSGLSPWLLVATLALLLIEPLMAWSFRHGLVLLITLIAVGLSVPFIPHDRWGAIIVAAVLLAGLISMALLGRRAASLEPATIDRRFSSSRRWFRFGRRRR